MKKLVIGITPNTKGRVGRFRGLQGDDEVNHYISLPTEKYVGILRDRCQKIWTFQDEVDNVIYTFRCTGENMFSFGNNELYFDCYAIE